MKYPIVEVTWGDHWADYGEHRAHEFRDDFEITSIGYLVRETDKVLSIAQGVTVEGEFSDTLHLHKALVRKRRLVRR